MLVFGIKSWSSPTSKRSTSCFIKPHISTSRFVSSYKAKLIFFCILQDKPEYLTETCFMDCPSIIIFNSQWYIFRRVQYRFSTLEKKKHTHTLITILKPQWLTLDHVCLGYRWPHADLTLPWLYYILYIQTAQLFEKRPSHFLISHLTTCALRPVNYNSSLY